MPLDFVVSFPFIVFTIVLVFRPLVTLVREYVEVKLVFKVFDCLVTVFILFVVQIFFLVISAFTVLCAFFLTVSPVRELYTFFAKLYRFSCLGLVVV